MGRWHNYIQMPPKVAVPRTPSGETRFFPWDFSFSLPRVRGALFFRKRGVPGGRDRDRTYVSLGFHRWPRQRLTFAPVEGLTRAIPRVEIWNAHPRTLTKCVAGGTIASPVGAVALTKASPAGGRALSWVFPSEEDIRHCLHGARDNGLTT